MVEVKPTLIPDNCPLPTKVKGFNQDQWTQVRSYCELIRNKCLKVFPNLDINLVAAVMMQESGGDSNAVSKTNATGLMQVMPDFEIAGRPSQKDLFDPEINIRTGCKILSDNIKRWGSIKDGLWAYYGTDSTYAEYADIVLAEYEAIKSAYP